MIQDELELELALSEPSEQLVRLFAELNGDLVILGAGGKMGPTLARMARRASEEARRQRQIYAISRFSDATLPERLASWGVRPVHCDLFDRRAIASLPEAANVIYLVGVKFGTSESQSRSWASNCYLPGIVCQRYVTSRIVALSTGNVYGMTATSGRGSLETDVPRPDGEYAMSALGRERVFEYFSLQRHIPISLIRLNYATELRYGVLVDLAQQVFAGDEISLAMGYVNVIWQADAIDIILRALETAGAPPSVWNVTGPQKLSCRTLAERFGELFGKATLLGGAESPDALLSDSSKAIARFGPLRTSLDEQLALTADWIERGQPIWNKPTQFEVRDGRF